MDPFSAMSDRICSFLVSGVLLWYMSKLSQCLLNTFRNTEYIFETVDIASQNMMCLGRCSLCKWRSSNNQENVVCISSLFGIFIEDILMLGLSGDSTIISHPCWKQNSILLHYFPSVGWSWGSSKSQRWNFRTQWPKLNNLWKHVSKCLLLLSPFTPEIKLFKR